MALVATGFGYEAAVRSEQGAVVAGLLPQVRDIRRAGAAGWDLFWGRQGVVEWDVIVFNQQSEQVAVYTLLTLVAAR